MAKSRTCFSSALCCSEWFERLPASARLLYYQLNFETNIIGEIVGARRVARGYGFSDGDFDTLVEAGLLIEIEGRCFVRHHFCHNGLANQAQRTAAEKAYLEISASLAFEEERFKGEYSLIEPTIDDVSPNVSLTVATKSNEKKTNENGIKEESNQIESKENAQSLKFASCPVCDRDCLIGREGHTLHGTCDCHGDFFIDPTTGEYLEGIA